MPNLKNLACSVQWADTNTPFQEYGTFYGDGVVEAFIVVPDKPQPFNIRLTSHGFIYHGLAAVVFIDGHYQCNRNRVNLVPAKKGVPLKRTQIDFLLRQKEKRVDEGIYMSREWRFDNHNTISELPPDIDENHFELLGTIEILVLRCHAKLNEEGNDSAESSAAESDILRDGAEDDSSTTDSDGSDDDNKKKSSSRGQNTEDDSGEGFAGGLFDGPSDYYHHAPIREGVRPLREFEYQPNVYAHFQDHPHSHRNPASHSMYGHTMHPPSYNSNSNYYGNPLPSMPPPPEKRVRFDCGPDDRHGHAHRDRYASQAFPGERENDNYMYPPHIDRDHMRTASEHPDFTFHNQLPEAVNANGPPIFARPHAMPYQPPMNGQWQAPYPPQIPSWTGQPINMPPMHPQWMYPNPAMFSHGPPAEAAATVNTFAPAVNGPTPASLDPAKDENNLSGPKQQWNPDSTANSGWNDSNGNGGGGNQSWDKNTGSGNYNNSNDQWNSNNNPSNNDQGNNWDSNHDQSGQDNSWNNQGAPNGADNGNPNPGDSNGWDSGNANQTQPNGDSWNNAGQQQPSGSWDNGVDDNQQGGWTAGGPDSGTTNHSGGNGNARALYGPHGAYYNTKMSVDTLECDAEEEPRYDVPQSIFEKTGSTKQVQPGKGYLYTKKRCVPEYLDQLDEPYARFVFRYRTKDQLRRELNIELDIEPSGDQEVQTLQNMDKEELIKMFLRAKGALGGKIPSPPPVEDAEMRTQGPQFGAVDAPYFDFLEYKLPEPRTGGGTGQAGGLNALVNGSGPGKPNNTDWNTSNNNGGNDWSGANNGGGRSGWASGDTPNPAQNHADKDAWNSDRSNYRNGGHDEWTNNQMPGQVPTEDQADRQWNGVNQCPVSHDPNNIRNGSSTPQRPSSKTGFTLSPASSPDRTPSPENTPYCSDTQNGIWQSQARKSDQHGVMGYPGRDGEFLAWLRQ